MKIRDDHYNKLLEAIKPIADKLPKHREFIIAEGKSKDIEQRLRWDALNAVQIDNKPSCFYLSNILYKSGLNDTHIDTALKNIMKDIGVV
jgi:hypothetical protein